MEKWTIILIVFIVFLFILILLFNNYDASPQLSNYSEIEIQMRKLWY